MGVYVKGMDMPEKCGLCDLFHAESPMYCTRVKGHKTVGAPYGMPRPDWCPLVEVPEPHGRLIDADALDYRLGASDRDIYVKYTVEEEPTVIEAEGK